MSDQPKNEYGETKEQELFAEQCFRIKNSYCRMREVTDHGTGYGLYADEAMHATSILERVKHLSRYGGDYCGAIDRCLHKYGWRGCGVAHMTGAADKVMTLWRDNLTAIRQAKRERGWDDHHTARQATQRHFRRQAG